MAYFSKITDTRRFAVEGRNEIFASYDYRSCGPFLAPVGMDDAGNIVFVAAPEYFFDDEVRELS